MSTNVSSGSAETDRAFRESQRLRLAQLRESLLRGEATAEGEERRVTELYGEEPKDTGDEAEGIARVETKSAVHAVRDRRLTYVERALQKIAEGSYGLSDLSGKPIPRERLEAVPEAIYTLEEEEDLEERERDSAQHATH